MHLFSEPYSAKGGIDARAARRAIGRPRLDPWALFVRELMQNSWDARGQSTSIDFFVDAYSLDEAQHDMLRSEIFVDLPPEGLSLGEALEDETVSLLVVTDRGTRGLGGPTRADLGTSLNVRTDFVDFARNVGRATAKGYGGGTYGFGKGVLWDASFAGTVLLFTRTRVDGRPVSRFMAIGLGDDYTESGMRFTGRHWWGLPSELTGAEPVSGGEAERLARSLGMTRLLEAESTGTSLAVVAPMAMGSAETVLDIMRSVAEGAMWSAWPHMIDLGSGPSIRFAFTCEGEEVPTPDPTSHQRLRHFVDAYRRVTNLAAGNPVPPGYPWSDHALQAQRPVAPLGHLAFRSYRETTASDDPVESSRHVALMRSPRFIVKYLPAPLDPRGLSLAGVFIAEESLDADFAKSEPVAHDDWLPENLQLEKFARNPVKQALDRISEALKRKFDPQVDDDADVGHEGAARLARNLGGLLVGFDGGGAEVQPLGRSRPGAKPTGRRRSKVTVATPPRLEEDAEGITATFSVHVQALGDDPIRLRALASTVLEGGALETAADRALGLPAPAVESWTAASGRSIPLDSAGSPRVPLASDDYFVTVRVPADTAVALEVQVDEVMS